MKGLNDILNRSKIYICPYCGTPNKLKNYMIMLSSGLWSELYKCEFCKEKMKKETLLANMTPYEWGLWLSCNMHKYNSPHNRFSEKVHLDSVFKNIALMEIGISNDFKRGYYFIRMRNINNVDKYIEEINYKYGIWKKRKPLTTLLNFSR